MIDPRNNKFLSDKPFPEYLAGLSRSAVMTRESDIAPAPWTRRQRLEAAIRLAVQTNANSVEEWEANLLDAIERFMDDWNREQITQHAEVDGWMLSVRNALLKRLGC